METLLQKHYYVEEKIPWKSVEHTIKGLDRLEMQSYEHGRMPAILENLNKMSREELAATMKTRYEVSHFFNDLLAELLKSLRQNMPEKRVMIETLEENLREEMGASDQKEYGKVVHATGRQRLLEALGENYKVWSESKETLRGPGDLHPASRKFVNAYKRMVQENPVVAYASLAYWEHRVSRPKYGDYPIFLNAFETVYPEWKQDAYVPGDPLWHLASHAEQDQKHAQEFFQALIGSANTPSLADQMQQGLFQGKRLWDEYWAELNTK